MIENDEDGTHKIFSRRVSANPLDSGTSIDSQEE
jgi:hypothetical protein